jgi:hypothetical protein
MRLFRHAPGLVQGDGVEVEERLARSMLEGDDRCEIMVEHMRYARE